MKKLILFLTILVCANIANAARKNGAEIYGATWCGPCVQLENDIAHSPGWKVGPSGAVHFLVITDFDPDKAGIAAMPTIIYYKDGKVVARLEGYNGVIQPILDTYTKNVKNAPTSKDK